MMLKNVGRKSKAAVAHNHKSTSSFLSALGFLYRDDANRNIVKTLPEFKTKCIFALNPKFMELL